MTRLLIVFLGLLATSAQADIYRWRDGRGVDHYTNSEYEIPARYRSRAVVLNLGLPTPAPESGKASGGQPTPALAPSPSVTPASPVMQSSPSSSPATQPTARPLSRRQKRGAPQDE